MYVYIGSNCLIILKGRVGKVSSAMGRRETEGIRMIGAAASRQVATPQVLVGEGQRQQRIPTRGHPGITPSKATTTATPQRTNPTKPPAAPSSDAATAASHRNANGLSVNCYFLIVTQFPPIKLFLSFSFIFSTFSNYFFFADVTISFLTLCDRIQLRYGHRAGWN